MDYLWLKAFHIAAVVTWIGGMLINALAIGILSPSPLASHSEAAPRLVETVRKWDRMVTSPAMLIVWVLGATMAVLGDWFWSPWLVIKLVIVLALSGLHGVQSGTLRRIASGSARKPPALLRNSAPIVLVLVLIIAILVVTKPF